LRIASLGKSERLPPILDFAFVETADIDEMIWLRSLRGDVVAQQPMPDRMNGIEAIA
jgi:hypothetical protein